MANPWDNDPVVSEPEPVEYVRVAPWENDPLQAAAQDGSLSVDNSVRSLATGVPIIGGALNRLDAATNATLAPLIDPILPDGFQKLEGGTWDERYHQALAIQAGKDDAFHEEHPYVDTGLNIAGGVAGTIPAVMAAPAAFGAGGGGLLLRSAASAATGGAMGGADAAVRSDGDLEQTGLGFGVGAGLGLLGPSIGKAVGAGTRAVMDKFRNWNAARVADIPSDAFTFLRRAVTDDGLDAAGLQQRLAEMGPDAMLADLGPNLQKQAGALAATPGRAQEIVRSALEDRAAGANARINATIDENFGTARLPSALDAEAAANQQAVGPAYRQAFEQARPYDVGPIASDLERQINVLRGDPQRALQRVRGMLNVHNSNVLDTNPVTMFNTRQAIDGMLKVEADPKVVAALTDARQMIDDALTRAVPQIKEADATFAELARQREAVGRGQQVLDSGRTAPRPQELVQEVEHGVQPQGMQIGPSAVPLRLSQGARAEIERIVGTNSNDIAAMNRLIKGEGDWNRSRLATLFGPEKADRVFKVLENERVFADTANTVTRNSESAARIAAQNELGGAGGGGFGLKESFKAGGVRGAARSFAMDKIENIAKALLPDGSAAARENLATALVDRQRDSLANVVRALAVSGNIGKTPALVDPVVKALLLTSGSAGTR
ncbi:hypothetical protein [Rhizobium mesosinicum]|uniref:Uncharacterized protein n=1 Tax=Rhizobium mesosinicum TaxID=335017 RepID=A0ABS7GU26_9HYPH|nr:hypothetical protein [Rhizobium mesosinicum]MBW9053463.1 hypothetical protein [Rhizobium mesosinicum]